MKYLIHILPALLLLCAASDASRASEELRYPSYVGSDACESCHAEASDLWKGSHHDLAWTLPSEGTVAGDFDGATFEGPGIDVTFTRRGDAFIIQTTEPPLPKQEFRVVGVAGIAPLQQYLVETGDGHVQSFDVVWDMERRQWYHLYPEQTLAGDDGLNWRGPYKNWNSRCAECHATDFKKSYNPRKRTYESSQSEIGVGCEACHGPSEAHVIWAQDPDQFDATGWKPIDNYGLTIPVGETDQKRQLNQCAGCHARREPLGDTSPPPGGHFDDHYRLSLLSPGLYFPDGQIRDEVYVYGSFLQSKMYAKGVACLDCHDAHSGRLKADGNSVCTQCHNPQGNTQYPSLIKFAYDSRDHHNHDPQSEAGQCVNCHMTDRVYMGIDARRDHSFRVPRPDLSKNIDVPNACSTCHDGETVEWAVKAVEQWYPASVHRGKHFGEIFARADKRLDPGTVDSLLDIALDQDNSAIVRASALDRLRISPSPAIADRTAPLLIDNHAIIRAASVPLQRAAPLHIRVERIANLLNDPIRSVRIAAVRDLLDVPEPPEDSGFSAGFKRAMSEYQGSLFAKADFPETQMVIGGVALTIGNRGAAERAFTEATILDPQLVEAWLMVARLRNEKGQTVLADQAIEEAFKRAPDNVQAKTAYGIMQARQKAHATAIPYLNEVIAEGVESPEVYLALVQSYLGLGDAKSARQELKQLDRLFPNSLEAKQARQLMDLIDGRRFQ